MVCFVFLLLFFCFVIFFLFLLFSFRFTSCAGSKMVIVHKISIATRLRDNSRAPEIYTERGEYRLTQRYQGFSHNALKKSK